MQVVFDLCHKKVELLSKGCMKRGPAVVKKGKGILGKGHGAKGVGLGFDLTI